MPAETSESATTRGTEAQTGESALPASLLGRLNAERQRLREVAARAFRAQEAERSRLARELQEEFAQRLTGILLRLTLARNAGDDTLRDEHFEELRRQLVELTEALNHYARGLHPPALTELGPIAAAQAYARLLTEGSDLRITFEGADPRELLDGERELALYRIVQEALANTARHAGACRAVVRTVVDDAAVEVRIEDDGAGFQLEEIEAKGGCIGILGMQERALYVGGTVRVETAPGRGTTVVLRLPLGDRAGSGESSLRVMGSTPPATPRT